MNQRSFGLRQVLFLLIATLLAVVGWFITQAGFSAVQSLRQIERLPTSTVGTALVGEVKINASAQQGDKLLRSEHFNIPSIYYRYRYEEEERDSDGNTHWSTKYTHADWVDFNLKDDTGNALIHLGPIDQTELELSLPISQQVTRGSQRYTEWRIEPGDAIFLLGFVESTSPRTVIGFNQPGEYRPLISKYSEAEEKSDIGLSVILLVCGGISLMGFACYFLTLGLQIHRILAFLFLLSAFIIVPLVHLGTSMLYQDIVNGSKRLQHNAEQTLAAVRKNLHRADLQWQDLNRVLLAEDLTPQVKEKSSAQLLAYGYSQQQFNRQLEKFPNNFIAWLYDIQAMPIDDYLNQSQAAELKARLAEFKQASTRGLPAYAVIIGGLLLAVVLTFFALKLIRLKRHIENLPTSKTRGVVFGLSELKGRINQVEQIAPLVSPLTHASCFWYHYIVKERRQSGKETKWVTIEDRQQRAEFILEDAYGSLKVDPEHAEIVSQHKKVERRGKRRYTEYTLKRQDKAYLLGPAVIDADLGDQLMIKAAKKDKPYLITNLSERAIMMRKAAYGMLALTFAFSGLIFAALFYLGSNGSFSPADYLLAALVAPGFMSVVVLILHYNDLIFLRQRAARNYSNIDVALQKRFDLLPNLEKVVRRYLEHEKSLLQSIGELRTMMKSANHQDAAALSQSLSEQQSLVSNIIGKVEDYPDLKAVSVHLKLMNQLVDLENEIGLMREGYNDATTYYNTRIESVPDVFFARLFAFKPLTLLTFEARQFKRLDFAAK